MFLEKYRLMSNPPARFARFVVDGEKCTGCGRCVEACPMQILGLIGDLPGPNERYDFFRCITCQNCRASCPQDAIVIEGDYRIDRGFWKNSHLFEGGKTPPRPFEDRDRTPFEEYENELTETERVILKRRSVRLYKKKPVEREKLIRIIEAGRFAPSAGNNQPWKFIVITDKEVIDDINRKCKKSLRLMPWLTMPGEWLDKKTPGDKNARLRWWQRILLPVLCRFKTGDVEPRVRGGINTVSSDPEYHTFFDAPVLIILLADKRGIGSVHLDTGICGQNMVLAAHAMGLGTCYVSLIRGLTVYPDTLRKLGVTDPFTIITSIAVGYPKGRVDKVVDRERARVKWIE